MITEIQQPGLIVFGAGALARLADVLAKVGVRRPLVVTDRGLAKTPVFAQLTRTLAELKIEHGVYADTQPDPDMDAVAAGAQAFRDGHYDGFIGFRGGSAMDTAKAINLWLHSDGDLRAWRVPKAPTFKTLPLVCVPTTAGTGSEVTRGIVITDPATHEKIVFMGLSCVPAAAICDPDLTRELPLRIAADTGLDALTHAIEAYVSRKRNPHSDSMALSAMQLIGHNIVSACVERSDEARNDEARDKARSAMMLGAMQAGIAFSNASVALVHGMSRPLGSFFGMPHGMSNAVLLPDVTKFSLPAATQRYADCARAIGFADTSDTDDAANAKLIGGLKGLLATLKVPTLAQFGITRDAYFDKIDTMAAQAVASGSPNNNPRGADAAEIAALYRQAWKQEQA